MDGRRTFRRSSIALGFGAVILLAAIAAFIALAVATERSNDRAQQNAISRFADRGEITAQLFSGSFQQSFTSSITRAEDELSGPVDQRDLKKFEAQSDALIPYSAVFDSSGTRIASYPSDSPAGETDGSRDLVLSAVQGNATTSNMMSNTDGEIIEFAVPFKTDNGVRVLVTAYPRALFASSIGSALANIELPDGGRVFLIDQNGALIGGTGQGTTSKLPGYVRNAVAGSDLSVDGRSGASHYVVRPIEGTTLAIAVVAPESAIIADLPDVRWPRFALIGMLVALFSAVMLLAKAARDTKRLELAREEADRANRAKSRFLSHITHELKTPITVIAGFADLLQRNDLELDEEHRREYARHITESGEHLTSLVNELLDVSRIEAGRVTLAIEPVDLRSIVEDVLVLAAPLAAERKIRLEPPTLREKIPAVAADQMRVRQVLLNLASNAIKFNHERGVARFRIEHASPGTVCVSVSDTGPGIPNEMLERLFEPFDRLDSEQKHVSGTGLGLAVSKGLIEAMYGRIYVSSELGVGSTFTFELPVVASLPSGEIAPPKHEVVPADHGEILCIDDSSAHLELVRQIIETSRPGVAVRTALDGSAGIESALEHRPDLLVLDLNLSDTTGERVVRRLRANPETADIPVLIASADSTSRDIARLLRTGADAYLTKPLDRDQFLDVVDRLLERTAVPL